MTASDLMVRRFMIKCQEAYANLRLPTRAAGSPLPAESTASQDSFFRFPSFLKSGGTLPVGCTRRELYPAFSTNLMAFQFAKRLGRRVYLLVSSAQPLLLAFLSRFPPPPGPTPIIPSWISLHRP